MTNVTLCEMVRVGEKIKKKKTKNKNTELAFMLLCTVERGCFELTEITIFSNYMCQTTTDV